MLAQKILISVVALSLVSISLNQPAIGRSTKQPKQLATAKQGSVNDDTAVRSKITTLKNCVMAGDATSMVKLWAEDGMYLDEEGGQYKGRNSLEKNFASIFKENGRQQVEILTESVRFPSNNVALVHGTVSRKVNAELVPMTHFSMVMEKKNGEWLISSATESQAGKEQATNPLQNLAWIIGDWSATREGTTATMKADWVPSHNFIFCHYEIKKNNEPAQVETQVIGWDPQSQKPLSWNFDSSGGFGQGFWSKIGNKWMVDSSGVQRDGCVSASTNVYADIAADSFSWQSVNRHINGLSMADTTLMKVQRVRH